VTFVTADRGLRWFACRMSGAGTFLDPQIRRRLRALALRSGRPQAELVREALTAYLDRRQGYRLPSWVGSWTQGDR
jgi:hypothetical protein